TVGWTGIVVVWEQRVSPTASKYGRLQYTTNGSDFIDFSAPTTMGTTNKFELKSADLSGYAGVDNNSQFALRVVTEFESTAAGSGINGYVTTSGVSYNQVGTV